MTYKELAEEYKKVFILVSECAGEKTGNSEYLKVEEILNDESNIALLKNVINQEPDFQVYVGMCISCLVISVHKLKERNDVFSKDITEYVNSYWNLYLKRPTIKFLKQNGLTVFDNFENGIIEFRRKLITK